MNKAVPMDQLVDRVMAELEKKLSHQKLLIIRRPIAL